MYTSWCIENSLTLKTENTVLQVKPLAIIVHVVLQQYGHDVYRLRHYYVWSFSGIFQQVFFFIPVSVSIEWYIQQHFHLFIVHSLVARHFTRRCDTGHKLVLIKAYYNNENNSFVLEWRFSATWHLDVLRGQT